MPSTQLKVWQNNALDFFERLPKKIFTQQEIGILFARNRSELGAPSTLSASRFLGFLQTAGPLRYVEITPEPTKKQRPVNYRTHKRYIWREVAPEALALSLRGGGAYLSHATAVFHHGLTQQLPKTIYANREQSAKPASSASLTQHAIDRAFQNAPRTSSYVYTYRDNRIVLLNGKNTGRLEVTELKLPSGEFVAMTKLERTLIDVAVRPAYSGGVFEVMEAYRSALSRLSLNVLVATLKKMDFVYPYHQAIGFYLERAGLPATKLSRLRSLGLNYNFYLTHKIANPQYDPTWKLYYPEGL